MNNNGFSLIEVIFALSLLSTTGLILLKQQWQAMLWENQQILIWQANQQLINACERLKVGLPPQSLRQPFHWLSSSRVTITWQVYQQTFERSFNCSKPLKT